jgi:hypothetical protein
MPSATARPNRLCSRYENDPRQSGDDNPLMKVFESLRPYYGDIHNHCNIGYGHGTIEEAFQNARQQLDFACVTAHAYWPDMPVDEARLAEVVAYHQDGFERTRKMWPHVQDVVETENRPGEFITFLGYEWHSGQYGDHTVYFKDSEAELIRAANLEEMRARLRELRAAGNDAFLIPHHIGYRQGYRGINWSTFTPEFSPVVEIISMHGGSESPDTPRPYLHTMGPLDWRSSYQYGLAQGHVVGVMGSTDHHSAHPGSYGHGQLAVWADALTRNGIWEAIKARRTVALTGDRIALAFSLNDAPLGSVVASTPERHIAITLEGGDALDYVELLRNNQVIQRWDGTLNIEADLREPVRVCIELGWGEKGVNVDWQVELEVRGGRLIGVEPRFRGHETVAPQADQEETYAFSRWERTGDSSVRFVTRTWGNPTTSTASTQGLCLDIVGKENTVLAATINGQQIGLPLSSLLEGPHAGYLGGFLTPAFTFHRVVPQSARTGSYSFVDVRDEAARDWYYVRVCQKNDQWAWSSPIWVEAARS